MGSPKFILSVILVFAIFSCRKVPLTAQEWIKWAEDPENGLKKSKEINEVKYTVMYKPVEYLQARSEISGNQIIKSHGTMEFNIRMEPVDGHSNVLSLAADSKEEALGRIEYYNGQISRNIILKNGDDIIYPSNVIYERYYNLSPAQTLVVGFDLGIKPIKDFKLIVDDKAINTGEMQFAFSIDDLNKAPKLKI